MSENTLSRMLKAYINLRDTRSKNKRAYDEQDADLKKKLGLIEVHLLKAMQASGSDSLKVAGLGTAVKGKRYKVNARDWNAINEYIIETGNLDILQRRLALNAIRAISDDNDGEVPPGVDLTTEITVTVRRN